MDKLKKSQFVFNHFKKSLEVRPFESYKFFKLIRMKTFLFACKHNLLISNIKFIYERVSRILGRRFVNKFVEIMYCDLLTGGANFNQLQNTIKTLEKDNVISIIDYCREFLTKEEEQVNNDLMSRMLKL